MRCDSCGMPRGVGKANAWEPNGVIVSRYERDLRGALYDVDELNNLFRAFSERIGFDITRLVVEGKRKDSKYYTRKLLAHMEDAGMDAPRPDEFFRIMAANYSIPGFGRIDVLDFNEGESITLAVENAYSRPMAEGQAAGVFEAVLESRARVDWEGDAERGRITLRVVEGEPELEQRIESEVEHAAPMVEEGGREYELCARCGAPLELSRDFDWNVEEATIRERRTGKRFIFDNVRGLNAVIQVMVGELGEEVESLISDISRAYARAFYRELSGERSTAEELSLFPLRGWGLPADLRRLNGGYTMQVLNPFHTPIIRGKVWGLIESLQGEDLAGGEWSEAGGVLRLSFSRC